MKIKNVRVWSKHPSQKKDPLRIVSDPLPLCAHIDCSNQADPRWYSTCNHRKVHLTCDAHEPTKDRPAGPKFPANQRIDRCRWCGNQVCEKCKGRGVVYLDGVWSKAEQCSECNGDGVT